MLAHAGQQQKLNPGPARNRSLSGTSAPSLSCAGAFAEFRQNLTAHPWSAGYVNSMAEGQVQLNDMEAFLRVAKYPLIKYTDMIPEHKEEAMDICITAVEKFPNDLEKCTQVRP